MKTYVCDMCKAIMGGNMFKRVYMAEIEQSGKIGKKRKVHLCKDCLWQIEDISRNKRSEQQ